MREYAQLSPGGAVSFCGGEPLLDTERFFAVCQVARREGLRLSVVTNGSMLQSPETAKRLLTDGVHEVCVSFDSIVPEQHDTLRGTPGAFAQAQTALRLLLEARAASSIASQHPFKINGMLLLSSFSLPSLHQAYQTVLRDWGADKLKLSCLQPSFMPTQPGQRDTFFDRGGKLDTRELAKALHDCNTEFDLHLDFMWIQETLEYYGVLREAPNRELGWGARLETQTVICNSAERNISVGVQGRLGLCHAADWNNTYYQKPGDLISFWRQADELRQRMSTCRRLCGISQSVRRTSATLKG
jgi:hypothetical protein